jgi:hypothetical protein
VPPRPAGSTLEVAGLRGSPTPDSAALALAGGRATAEGFEPGGPFAAEAAWARDAGALRAVLAADAAPGETYVLSFAVLNPPRPRPAEQAWLSATGGALTIPPAPLLCAPAPPPAAPPPGAALAERGEAAGAAAGGVVGDVAESEARGVTGAEGAAGGVVGDVAESEARGVTGAEGAAGGWYDSFERHLARQHPALFAAVGEPGGGAGGAAALLEGLNADLRVEARRGAAGELRVAWRAAAGGGPAALGAGQSVYILQLRARAAPGAPAEAAPPLPFRTVYAGAAPECVVAAALAPPHCTLALRIREARPPSSPTLLRPSARGAHSATLQEAVFPAARVAGPLPPSEEGAEQESAARARPPLVTSPWSTELCVPARRAAPAPAPAAPAPAPAPAPARRGAATGAGCRRGARWAAATDLSPALRWSPPAPETGVGAP